MVPPTDNMQVYMRVKISWGAWCVIKFDLRVGCGGMFFTNQLHKTSVQPEVQTDVSTTLQTAGEAVELVQG